MDKTNIIKVLENMQQEINNIVLLLNNADNSSLKDLLIENISKELEIKNRLLLQVVPQEQEQNKKCPCCKVTKHKADFINKNCTRINKTCNSCIEQINECIKTKKKFKQESNIILPEEKQKDTNIEKETTTTNKKKHKHKKH